MICLIKLKLPDELKQAKWVKEERQKILVDAQKDIKVYKVDMSLEENQKYMSEEVNDKAQTVSDLKINGITLMKVSKCKNVKYVIGSENIEEYLK